MTEDDKALVERLRDDWPEILVEKHWMMDSDAIDKQREEAAHRIETLSAEKEATRKEERAAIVAWLDKKAEDFALNPPHAYSDMIASIVSMSIMGCTETIEAGEHLK